MQILVVLGCFLDGSGSTETQIKGRLSQERKMFNKLRPMLCCPKNPEEERIQAFYTTVASSVLWRFSIDKSAATPLRSVKQMARLHPGWTKGPRRRVGGWFRATKRSAHALMCRLSLPALWHRAFAAMRGSAGHVAWKEAGTGARDQSWRHQKNNSVRGFERALSQIYGLGWWDAAKRSRESWQRGKYKFVSEAERRWGGSRLIKKKNFSHIWPWSLMRVSSSWLCSTTEFSLARMLILGVFLFSTSLCNRSLDHVAERIPTSATRVGQGIDSCGL